VFTTTELLLDTEEVVTLRDLLGMGTKAIYRLKSGLELEALRPNLRGYILILPSRIKVKLACFEGSGNLTIAPVKHQLIVSKEHTKQRLLPHMYLKEP